MLNTILVAVDGSKHSMRALEFAAGLAKKFDAALSVVSVYRHYSSLESTHSLVKAQDEIVPPDIVLSQLAQDYVDEAVARARELGAAKVQGMVKRGQPSRTIVETAKERKADAIVMGSRGLGDIGAMLLGSVSHKVSSLAECTCITVK